MNLPKSIVLLTSVVSMLGAKTAPSPLVTQKCVSCHGPDLNGVGGVFPSLLSSKVVKQGGLDAVVKFITYGSPPDSQSLVKMPAKGGHLDLTGEQIKQIAEEVIERAVAYTPAKVSPAKGASGNAGYFKERYGPLVSSAIEISPLVNWPPREDTAPELKELQRQEVQILADAVRLGGKEFENVSLEDFALNLRVDLTEPGDKVEGTSTKFPANEAPSNAIDDNPKTKYLNFDGKGSGLILEVGKSVAVGIALTSGNDAPERDPRTFALYGSKEGSEFIPVAAGAVPSFSARQQRKRFSFDNAEAYSFYKLIFPELVGPEGTPLQIGEVELIRKETSNLDNLVLRAKNLYQKMTIICFTRVCFLAGPSQGILPIHAHKNIKLSQGLGPCPRNGRISRGTMSTMAGLSFPIPWAREMFWICPGLWKISVSLPSPVRSRLIFLNQVWSYLPRGIPPAGLPPPCL